MTTNDDDLLPRNYCDDSDCALTRAGDCEVVSHLQCHTSECEVKRLLSQISEGQIKVTVLGMQLSLFLSTVMALGAFIFHLWCQVNHFAFEVYWWEATIIMAPFGGALVLKVKEQIPWKTEE